MTPSSKSKGQKGKNLATPTNSSQTGGDGAAQAEGKTRKVIDASQAQFSEYFIGSEVSQSRRSSHITVNELADGASQHSSQQSAAASPASSPTGVLSFHHLSSPLSAGSVLKFTRTQQ